MVRCALIELADRFELRTAMKPFAYYLGVGAYTAMLDEISAVDCRSYTPDSPIVVGKAPIYCVPFPNPNMIAVAGDVISVGACGAEAFEVGEYVKKGNT